jgi:hypothetical protein
MQTLSQKSTSGETVMTFDLTAGPALVSRRSRFSHDLESPETEVVDREMVVQSPGTNPKLIGVSTEVVRSENRVIMAKVAGRESEMGDRWTSCRTWRSTSHLDPVWM